MAFRMMENVSIYYVGRIGPKAVAKTSQELLAAPVLQVFMRIHIFQADQLDREKSTYSHACVRPLRRRSRVGLRVDMAWALRLESAWDGWREAPSLQVLARLNSYCGCSIDYQ